MPATDISENLVRFYIFAHLPLKISPPDGQTGIPLARFTSTVKIGQGSIGFPQTLH
jgi:hypothetical protein